MSEIELEPPIEPLTGEYLSRALDEIENVGQVPLCEAQVPGVVPRLWVSICDKPSVAVYRYACAHEHVRMRWTCDEHRPEPGIVGCRACWDAGHECPMSVQLVEVLE